MPGGPMSLTRERRRGLVDLTIRILQQKDPNLQLAIETLTTVSDDLAADLVFPKTITRKYDPEAPAPVIGDTVRYQGFETTIEAIEAEQSAYQYMLGNIAGLLGVVIFSHPSHPGWGFEGTPQDWAGSGIENCADYVNWPDSFIPVSR